MGEHISGAEVVPGLRHFGIELGSSLKVGDRLWRAICGGEQKTDLVLIGGGFGGELCQFFVRGERSIGIAGSQLTAAFGFELPYGGRDLSEDREAE